MFQARLLLDNEDMIMIITTIIMSERDEQGKRYEVRYEKAEKR